MTKEEQRIREYVKYVLREDVESLDEKAKKRFGLKDYWRRFKNALVSNPASRAAMVFIEDLKKDGIDVSSELETLINEKAKEYYDEESEDEDDADLLFNQVFRQLRSDPKVRQVISNERKKIDTINVPERNRSLGDEEAMEIAQSYISGLAIHHNIEVSRKTEQEILDMCERRYPEIRENLRDKRQAIKAMFAILNKKFGRGIRR